MDKITGYMKSEMGESVFAAWTYKAGEVDMLTSFHIYIRKDEIAGTTMGQMNCETGRKYTRCMD